MAQALYDSQAVQVFEEYEIRLEGTDRSSIVFRYPTPPGQRNSNESWWAFWLHDAKGVPITYQTVERLCGENFPSAIKATVRASYKPQRLEYPNSPYRERNAKLIVKLKSSKLRSSKLRSST